jgi:hypothetical protein
VEFRAVKEIIYAREHSRVMFVRTDDGVVEGVFETDGFVDARQFSPAKIAEFIYERLSLLLRCRKRSADIASATQNARTGDKS